MMMMVVIHERLSNPKWSQVSLVAAGQHGPQGALLVACLLILAPGRVSLRVLVWLLNWKNTTSLSFGNATPPSKTS